MAVADHRVFADRDVAWPDAVRQWTEAGCDGVPPGS